MTKQSAQGASGAPDSRPTPDGARVVKGSSQDGRVSFPLEDRRTRDLWEHDPQLRHRDHASAATVHGFKGRTADNAIAAIEAKLLTDAAKALRE